MGVGFRLFSVPTDLIGKIVFSLLFVTELGFLAAVKHLVSFAYPRKVLLCRLRPRVSPALLLSATQLLSNFQLRGTALMVWFPLVPRVLVPSCVGHPTPSCGENVMLSKQTMMLNAQGTGA